jgi:hypothetical protein
MIRSTSTAVALAAGLAACGSPARGTIPEDLVAVPDVVGGAGPADDRGELVLRSGGKDIGREAFTTTRDGRWLKVELTAAATFPDPIAIKAGLWVEPSSWRVDRYDLHVERGGAACTFLLRHRDAVVDVEVVHPDGSRRNIDREPREHAEYHVSIRPALTNTAVCVRADAQPRALESFSPWYVVRTAPRVASKLATADGARQLDLVKVDGLIDVYCDGGRLAIVHYPKHAFIAARTEYDAAAQALTAADPVDELWAGEVACPPPEP